MPDNTENTQNKKPINFYRIPHGEYSYEDGIKEWLKFKDKTQEDIAFFDIPKAIYVGDKCFSNYRDTRDLIINISEKALENSYKASTENLLLMQEYINYKESLNNYPEAIERIFELEPWQLRVNINELFTLYPDNPDGTKVSGISPITTIIPPFGTHPFYKVNHTLPANQNPYDNVDINDAACVFNETRELEDDYYCILTGKKYYAPDYNIIGEGILEGEEQFDGISGALKQSYTIEAYNCNPNFNYNSISTSDFTPFNKYRHYSIFDYKCKDSIVTNLSSTYNKHNKQVCFGPFVIYHHRDKKYYKITFKYKAYKPTVVVRDNKDVEYTSNLVTNATIQTTEPNQSDSYVSTNYKNNFDIANKILGHEYVKAIGSDVIRVGRFNSTIPHDIFGDLGKDMWNDNPFFATDPCPIYVDNNTSIKDVVANACNLSSFACLFSPFKYAYIPTLTFNDVHNSELNNKKEKELYGSTHPERTERLISVTLDNIDLISNNFNRASNEFKAFQSVVPSKTFCINENHMVQLGDMQDITEFEKGDGKGVSVYEPYFKWQGPDTEEGEALEIVYEDEETGLKVPNWVIQAILYNKEVYFTTGFFGIFAGCKWLKRVEDDFIYVDPKLADYPGVVNNFETYKECKEHGILQNTIIAYPLNWFLDERKKILDSDRIHDIIIDMSRNNDIDKIPGWQEKYSPDNEIVKKYKLTEKEFDRIIWISPNDIYKVLLDHTFSDKGFPLKKYDFHFNINISYAFTQCYNLTGESPSLTFRGKKYKLWEINEPYEKFYGKPLFRFHFGTFKGCTHLSDYNKIPDDWK